MHLVHLHLTTGWLADRQNGANFEILKFVMGLLFAAFNKVTALLEQNKCT